MAVSGGGIWDVETTSLGRASLEQQLETLEGLRNVSIQQGSGWKWEGRVMAGEKLWSSLGHITKHVQNFGIHLFTLLPKISKAVSTCIMLGILAPPGSH